MARPHSVDARWHLVQLAAAAGVGRGTARTAVERGYLPREGYTAADIALLRVAAACLAHPDPDEPLPPKHALGHNPVPPRRDRAALRAARAILADPHADPSALIVLAGPVCEVADRAADLPDVLVALGPAVSVLLPVGAWKAELPALGRVSPVSTLPRDRAAAPVPAALASPAGRVAEAATDAADATREALEAARAAVRAAADHAAAVEAAHDAATTARTVRATLATTIRTSHARGSASTSGRDSGGALDGQTDLLDLADVTGSPASAADPDEDPLGLPGTGTGGGHG